MFSARRGLVTAAVLATVFMASPDEVFAQDDNPDALVKTLFPDNDELPSLHLREIADRLMLHAGSQVADVGCGQGEIALVWARLVGPGGHVWAEDINPSAIEAAGKLMDKYKAHNVTVLHGKVDDPLLPAGKLDAITLFFVYHELTHYPEMLAHFREALKPEGRLVILDPVAHKTAIRPRATQAQNHVLRPDLAEQELRNAGFRIVSRDDSFVDNPGSEGTDWLIVARPAPP